MMEIAQERRNPDPWSLSKKNQIGNDLCCLVYHDRNEQVALPFIIGVERSIPCRSPMPVDMAKIFMFSAAVVKKLEPDTNKEQSPRKCGESEKVSE